MTVAAVRDKGGEGVAARATGVPVVDCAGITKSFDGVPVLRGIGVGFRAGSVNVLAGENGAGKSTLFKIIAGQLTPDGGTLRLAGEPVRRFQPAIAQALGVSIIPQELAPIPQMRVWQNLLVGREICGPFGLLRRAAMVSRARAMLASVGLDLDPELPMQRLGVAATQMVEILKATSRDARIVLMDEPTSSLSARETAQLFRVIATLRAQGACILYTSHRMEEIEAIADTVTVMRDGQIIRHAPTAEWTERGIIADMVGREIAELFPGRRPASGERGAPVLELGALRVGGYDARVSLAVHGGEIVGLGGLIGAGRSELLEAIFGMRPASGEMRLDGVKLPLGDMAAAIRRGIAMVPEDRKAAGVLTSMSILDNVTLPHLDRFTGPGGVLDNARRRAAALDVLARTRVRYARLTQKVAHLSGGNQQKVALARWLVTAPPRLLILDEPTRGIDVGARSELYRLIDELAAQGVAILLASSDMPELINLSHRVLVMRAGRVMGELAREALEPQAILRLAMGLGAGNEGGGDERA